MPLRLNSAIVLPEHETVLGNWKDYGKNKTTSRKDAKAQRLARKINDLSFVSLAALRLCVKLFDFFTRSDNFVSPTFVAPSSRRSLQAHQSIR
jgi:hypothetical protein